MAPSNRTTPAQNNAAARRLGQGAYEACAGNDPRLSRGIEVGDGTTIAGERRRLQLIAGTHVTISAADNPTGESVDVTITSSGGGGGGAPTGAHYVVAQMNGSLTNEQLLTDTTSITWDLGTPGLVTADVVTGSLPGTICAGDDARLSDPRTADSISETGDPAILIMGAVPDGTYLQRSGMFVVGATPSGGAGADLYVIRKVVALRL